MRNPDHMDKLTEAFNAWQQLAPYNKVIETHLRVLEFPLRLKGKTRAVAAHYDGHCCSRKDHHDDEGKPLPDDSPHMCARELSWRIYTRLRDGLEPRH